ncbi:DUF1328 domain-containing protein [Sphingomonas sp.]|jgi:uncharacterized membrane protein YtjA (UPF0391 family)|uniref:DUF1328 domain-containing protein n=1 Tax=Sphingomonas sp. TaxID=28214 RepID=UPI002E31B2DC|nr:DUF1328 domain-containing protein [Sphingomonas sp.]HEX4695034.1 DUF1328 domain-containing protein [Sphingomonas sp.]
MLRWAIIFAIIALVLGLLGFGGIASAFAGVAKLLFFIAIAIFVVLLALGVMAGRAIKKGVD